MSINSRVKEYIEKKFSFQLNNNQWKDIKRLLFEINKRENISIEAVIKKIENNTGIKRVGGRNKFFVIKKYLINLRFPITAGREDIDPKKVYLTDIKEPISGVYHPQKEFKPEKIFVEKEAKKSFLIKRLKEFFPDIEIEELKYYSLYLKKNRFSLKEMKRPIIFVIKEKWDFIKICPCTKHHLRCGYWIFNLGFGCPFDCSYCFLQHYTNFPGIILPHNLDDFFNKFNEFSREIKKPVRIGTGEFCDSLALDEITNYSSELINFFRNKKIIFELKTKSSKIDNLLNTPASDNIVISWSLNPPNIIRREELATANLRERLTAAKKVQNKGFPVAFHFDPIIHYPDWDKDYKELVQTLYQHLRPPFKWISLGTLRCSRELKQVVEKRFPESDIFYGELFIGEDRKLRYSRFIREEIYTNMVKWIREFDQKTPVYLCMEDIDMWKIIGDSFKNTSDIEQYIIGSI